MNKKDIENYRKEKELEEESILMRRIHENAKENNINYMINEQVKKIKREKKIKQEKSEERALTIIIIAFVLISLKIIGIV